MIYVFDLDGTICDTPGNKYEESKPIQCRINKVNKLFNEGHTIIIDSARGCTSGRNWFYYTCEQLKNWGLLFHHLRTGHKFGGDVFVDDKGVEAGEFFQS
jgi:hypothetical protein